MERYPMNRQGCRPKNPQYQNYSPAAPCPCKDKADSMYAPVDKMPLAMAYIPMQEFTGTFELCRALRMGTIFPELCKPFCGQRRGCPCR